MVLQGAELCQSAVSFIRHVWAERFSLMFAASTHILMKYWLRLVNESPKKNSGFTVQILLSLQSWWRCMSVCNADLWYFITMKVEKKWKNWW